MKNKVLVAMGIGIFAALTFNATSVTTLAAEGDPDPQDPNENNQYDFDKELKDAQDTAGAADTLVDTALETITGNEEKKVEGTNDAEKELEDAAKEVYGESKLPITEGNIYEETKPDSQNINTELTDGDWVDDYDAKDGKDDTDTSNLHKKDGVDVKEALNDADEKLKALDSQESVVAGAVGDVYKAAETGNQTVDAADGLVKKANIIVGIEPDPKDPEKPSLSDTIKAANDEVDKASVIIANAGSEEEAKAALDVAQKAVNDANQKVEQATQEIEKIEAQLAELEKQDSANREELENKKTALRKERESFYALKQEALADAAAADAELTRLINEMDKLYNDTLDADKEYDENVIVEYKDAGLVAHREDGYAIIKALEDKLSDPTTTKNLSDYRTLVWAIMKYYYIPEVEGGVMTDTCDAFINDNNFKNDKSKWQAVSGQYAYIDAEGEYHQSTEGDVLRYGTVHYTLNGKDCEMKVNYKTVDENNLGASNFPGLVIFKKTEHQMIRVDNGSNIPTEMEITDAFRDEIDEKGYYIDVNGNVFGKDENGKIIRYDDGTTDYGDIPEDEVENVENLSLAAGESKKDVAVGEEKVIYSVGDGKVIKTVTVDVNTTTYTGISDTTTYNGTIDPVSATLASIDAAKNAFIAAVQEKINALGENQTLKIGNTEYKKGDTATDAGFDLDDSGSEVISKGYTVTGTYQKVISDTIKVSDWGYGSKTAAENAFLNPGGEGHNKNIKEYKEGDVFGFGGHYEGKYEVSEKINEDSLKTWVNVAGWHYSGTVDIRYSDIVAQNIKEVYSVLGPLLNGKSTKEKVQAAKDYITENGGTVVDYIVWDGNAGSASLLYVPGVSKTITVSDAKTAEAAKEAFLASLGDDVNKVNVSSTQELTDTVTRYGYKALSYILSTTTVNTEVTGTAQDIYTVSTTVYSNAAATERTRFRNDNWYSGNIILLEKDNNLVSDEDGNPISISYLTDGNKYPERNVPSSVTVDANQNDDFRNKIDGIGKVPAAYANLIEKAKASKAALVEADAKVKLLEKEISELECKNGDATIREMKNLQTARENLKKVQGERDDLIKKLDDLKKQYDDKIEELNTPTPTVMIVSTTDVVVDAPLIVDAPADDFVAAPAIAPVGAVLGANRPLETLGSVRSGSVLGERRGPQGAVLGKRRSPKTADGAMGGMVAGMMLSMMSAFGGAKVLKKKDEE